MVCKSPITSRSFTITIAFALVLAASGSAHATQVYVNGNDLRLEQYATSATTVGDTAVWKLPIGQSFPGGCTGVGMVASAPQGERSRFFSLVLMAKATGKTVMINYGADCKITSFGADGW